MSIKLYFNVKFDDTWVSPGDTTHQEKNSCLVIFIWIFLPNLVKIWSVVFLKFIWINVLLLDSLVLLLLLFPKITIITDNLLLFDLENNYDLLLVYKTKTYLILYLFAINRPYSKLWVTWLKSGDRHSKLSFK